MNKMIPESKLNWSYDRPKFEDVEGKTIVCEYDYGSGDRGLQTVVGMTKRNYEQVFDNGFSHYAIIDTGEEPLPLDGVMPKTNETTCWVDIDGIQICGFGNTRQEAINKYNKLVRRIK